MSHLKEGYVNGSLIVNAMHESGYSDDQIGIFYHAVKIANNRGMLDSIRRAVAKYLQRRLIPGIAVK